MTDRAFGMRHLLWIPAGAVVSFFAAYIFGDRLTLPVDFYYAIYFACVVGFFAVYAKRTQLDLRTWVGRRWGWGIALGLGIGTVMAFAVVSRPATEPLTGGLLAWALLWRGVVYGAVDGLLLFAFPWVVVWRAFDAEAGSWRRKLQAAAAAWVLTLGVTTLYHLGYADFRSRKVVQPNVGSAITAVATLVSANPVASPIAHVMLHVAAVVHSPYTDLFLPPHRENRSTSKLHRLQSSDLR
jgi:hypothetical protein